MPRPPIRRWQLWQLPPTVVAALEHSVPPVTVAAHNPVRACSCPSTHLPCVFIAVRPEGFPHDKGPEWPPTPRLPPLEATLRSHSVPEWSSLRALPKSRNRLRKRFRM